MTSDGDDGVGRSLSFLVSSMCVCECVKEGGGEEGVSGPMVEGMLCLNTEQK